MAMGIDARQESAEGMSDQNIGARKDKSTQHFDEVVRHGTCAAWRRPSIACTDAGPIITTDPGELSDTIMDLGPLAARRACAGLDDDGRPSMPGVPCSQPPAANIDHPEGRIGLV